LASIQCGG